MVYMQKFDENGVEELGSFGVCILDGRLGLNRLISEADEYAELRRWPAYEIRKTNGQRFLDPNPQILYRKEADHVKI